MESKQKTGKKDFTPSGWESYLQGWARETLAPLSLCQYKREQAKVPDLFDLGVAEAKRMVTARESN